jgi:thiamine biosynthesis lipoprotein
MSMDALLSPRRRRVISALGAAALGMGCSASSSSARELRFAGATMGSTYSVHIAGAPFAAGLEGAAQAAVSAAFERVVRLMSTYDPDSELCRFNNHASTQPFELASETLAVLKRGQQVAALSNGAFDVTVAPLVGAWGFGAGACGRGAVPQVGELSAPVGWQRLALDTTAGTARKAVPGLRIDLSGIAKGHAVDRAAQALEALGIERYMVEAGGEIRTRGRNASGAPWQIAIERPDAWPQQAHRIVGLQGLSMATSGDYRNFYELDGRRITHEIDPATRAPADNGLASVSVVHAECMAADALATALMIMGAQRGMALARRHGLAAFFIVRDRGGALRDLASPAFGALG